MQMTETTQMQSTNLLHSISNPILSCVLTVAVFPSKEHESKVPEPPFRYTAPPWVIDILSLNKMTVLVCIT